MFRKLDLQRVEIVLVQLFVAQLFQFPGQESGRGVDASGNVLQAFGSVINGVEAGHGGKQGLSRTDIGSRFLAFDMLFTCLQCQTVGGMSVSIFGNTDDASGNGTFILVLCRKEGSRRTAVEHRNTEALAASEHHVRTPFSRRSQQDKAHQVGSNGYAGFVCVGTCDKGCIVFN